MAIGRPSHGWSNWFTSIDGLSYCDNQPLETRVENWHSINNDEKILCFQFKRSNVSHKITFQVCTCSAGAGQTIAVMLVKSIE